MSTAIQQIQQRAVEAINRGRYAEVDRLCEQILGKDRSFADAWFLKAMAAAGRMDIRAALPLLVEALKLAPKNPEYLAQFAKLCALVNQTEKAMQAADRAVAENPQQALTLDTIGVVYTKLGAFDKAQATLQRAVERAPENYQFHFNLASAEQFLGNHRAAETHYKKAIELKPGFARAHWALSELNKNEADSDQIERLTQLLSKDDLSDDDELYLCHALSREKEKQGDYDAAFDLLERGKFRYRSKLNYSWVVDERLFEAVKSAFPVNQKAAVDQTQGQDAIFILGMPRSGTTLVERILSSHSSVESLGELQNFGLAVKQESGTTGRTVLDVEVAQQTDKMDFGRIGRRYLDSVAIRRDTNLRFIDKMPLNFLQLGYIAESLPGAKIVLLKRNAMDTCLSNFRQLFAVSFSYYNYHYDLVDTGHYYRLFDDLINHWLALFEERIHIVDYEALTDEPESHIRGLLQYCDLPWQPECLAFHENKSAVATASTMQVRQPMYRSSVQRWKKYETQLQPLKQIFDEAGIEY